MKNHIAAAYFPNQLGFSETGTMLLDIIKPRIEEIGIKVYDPFVECGKEFDLSNLNSLEKYSDRERYLKKFSQKIGKINNALMKKSDCLIAILDGGHSVDDGVASEIGFYAGIKRGPIFALRSDFRLAENMALSINAQILSYIQMSRGYLAEPPNAMDKWHNRIKKWHSQFQIKNDSNQTYFIF